jgi:Mg2+ and Co2+ transporter CorA
VIARHFRTGQAETTIEDVADLPAEPGTHELLWVDFGEGEQPETAVLDQLGFGQTAEHLGEEDVRPRVLWVDDVALVTVLGLTRVDDDAVPDRRRVDLLARGNVVLTIRQADIAGLSDLVELVQGRSELGSLDAATFVALLMDGLLGAFFDATEDIERDLDELDDRALRASPDRDFTAELIAIRRRIAFLRRTLVPHRGVVAALARPELGINPAGVDPWPGVLERLERAIDAVENARDLLLGSFDLAMTRAAQRTNDIVRILTVVSVTLLPASVLAGIFGMNFTSPIFDVQGMFIVAVAFVVLVCIAILALARWRHWL